LNKTTKVSETFVVYLRKTSKPVNDGDSKSNSVISLSAETATDGEING
jgi:hypothetical protein